MKKIMSLCAVLTLFLMGCETVTRHYEKDATGSVVVTTHHADGNVTTQKYNDPKVKSLEGLGLNEKEAVQLIANGAAAESFSSTPTTLGWVLIIVLVILVIIIVAASGDGFFAGMMVEDLLDD